MKRFYHFLLLQLIWLVPAATAAQDATCPAIVEQALAATNAACSATGRNQACYGNIKLSAQPQEGAPAFNFSQPGDLADVAGIQSLTLSPLNQQVNTWGVALMNIQANLPDTLPGQNVAFVLFGDVQLQNAVPTNVQQITLELTPNGTMNVRSGPSQANPVIASLPGGQTVVTDGRNEAGDWLRIQLDTGDTGWVYAPLVMVDGDPQTLEAVSADAVTALKPMQAFYFKTGALDSPCAEAPDSGILIQSPNTAVKIDLLANGVHIGLGSTIYIQAQPNGLMTINVLEGGVRVSLGNTAFVPAGARVQIQLDQNLNPVFWTGVVEPYDFPSLAALPIDLLPTPIIMHPPLAKEEMEAAQDTVAETFPRAADKLGREGGRMFD